MKTPLSELSGMFSYSMWDSQCLVHPGPLALFRSKWLSGAILDVFPVEPLPRSSPLWSMPEVPSPSALQQCACMDSGLALTGCRHPTRVREWPGAPGVCRVCAVLVNQCHSIYPFHPPRHDVMAC